MDFRILGPLEVAQDGNAVPIRGSRVRSLLAMLLVDAGEVVPADRLMEGLWGNDWPGSGRAALRMRVSQLRRTLEDARGDDIDGPLLLAKPPGYVLRAQPDDIDARRFERLVATGRRDLAAQRPRDAATTLREALALWRGPALAGVADDPRTEMEAMRLEELRSVAVEERVDADLALGRHDELIADLQVLVADEPLRERRYAQLMLALYRSGRQAEALETYREARDVLVRELGIEPGRALADLEIAILRQEPALDLAGATGPTLPWPAGELKLVTVLVCELDSPAGDDLERVVALEQRHRDAVIAEARDAGGRAETFSADTLMVIFGAPVALEDHAVRALHAALAMRRRLQEFGDATGLRIGIESGPVVVGDRGSPTRGTTVTSATRLQRAAASGTIIVGERAVTAVGGVFEFGEPVSGGTRCRPLTREVAPPTPFALGRSALVGRERELEQLRASFRRVAAGRRPEIVTVVGTAGVGKSRLAAEFWTWLSTQSPRPARHIGRCLAYGAGATYRPLAEVLRAHLGVRETDPEDAVRAALGARPILGLTLGLDVAGDIHPLAAREQLREAWAELLRELTSHRPVVVLVEDLHWGQGPLLELIERLAGEVGGPLLLVGTARPELHVSRPDWAAQATTIHLGPLDADQSSRLIAELAPPDLSPDLRRLVLDRAEGNPFFLEELLASLVDPDPSPAAVPDSVRALLAARIDMLPPTEKTALQAAAVVGRSFWRGAVRELLGGERPDFALLEAREFVRRRPSSALAGEQELTFKHALTCEVAYAGLTTPVRARMHAGFAQWLEGVAESRDEHAAMLAHHYAEAVSPEDADLAWSHDLAQLEALQERAVTWLRRAADVDIRRYDLDDALASLTRALALTSDSAVRAELWRTTARVHALRYDGDAFWNALHAAIDLTTDRHALGDLYAELAFETATRGGIWQREPDRELVDGWIERAVELAEPASLARARALTARCYWIPAGSDDAAHEALRFSESLGDTTLESYALDGCAIAAFLAEDFERATRAQERRLALRDRIDDPDHLADIHVAPLTLCAVFGDRSKAQYLIDRYDEITGTLTPHHRLHGVAARVEVAELFDGPREMHALADRVEASVHESRDTPCVRGPRSLLVCALAARIAGDDARADQLEAQAEAGTMEGYGHVLDTPRLRLALWRRDVAEVERLLAEPLPERGWHRGWLLLSTHAARLDALAALGRRSAIEEWRAPRAGTFLEPFHQRALGIVRDDDALIEAAGDRFGALGLDWQAEQTRHDRSWPPRLPPTP